MLIITHYFTQVFKLRNNFLNNYIDSKNKVKKDVSPILFKHYLVVFQSERQSTKTMSFGFPLTTVLGLETWRESEPQALGRGSCGFRAAPALN